MSRDGQVRQDQSISLNVQQLGVGHTVVHVAGDVIGDAAAVVQQTLIGQLSGAPT